MNFLQTLVYLENKRIHMRLINKPTLNEINVQEAKENSPYKAEN